MTSRVVTVEPGVSVLHAARLMLQNQISGLPVVDAGGNLVGIVTEGDLLRRVETGTERRRPHWLEFLLSPGKQADDYVHTHGRKVEDVMTHTARTVAEDVPLDEIVKVMEKHRIKRLPVMRGPKLIGIVSRANLLQALACLAGEATPATPDDATIRRQLLSELDKQNWAPHSRLNILVRNAIVDLWGTITDERQRQALIVAAENTPGVKGVRDHLAWIELYSGVLVEAPDE